jgi:hypothetical protein
MGGRLGLQISRPIGRDLCHRVRRVEHWSVLASDGDIGVSLAIGDRVAVAIEDRGVGVDPAAARALAPVIRTKAATKGQAQGDGDGQPSHHDERP